MLSVEGIVACIINYLGQGWMYERYLLGGRLNPTFTRGAEGSLKLCIHSLKS